MENLHRSAYDPACATFFVPGGYDEKEAVIKNKVEQGWRVPEQCHQTCVFGSGYYVTLIPPPK